MGCRHRLSTPSHAASWRRAGRGRKWRERPPIFGAGAPPGRGRWCTLKSTTTSPLFGVAPSTVIPGGKAIERCSGLRASARAGQVAGPVTHEPAPALEQFRALVGCLDLAVELVRQGSLHHLARMIGLIGRPVPKARPEAVRPPRCRDK